jgi:hypothetical protein
MRIGITAFVFFALCFASAKAEAAPASSCSSFAVIKSYDEAASSVEVSYEKGKQQQFFPKPEGTPRDSSKIPKNCGSKVKKTTELVVKATGGRLSVTQVRSNFQGKMLNDRDDKTWLPAKLKQLIADQTKVVIVVRPGVGKDAPLGITTLYLPITDEELAEIQRIEDEAEDV